MKSLIAFALLFFSIQAHAFSQDAALWVGIDTTEFDGPGGWDPDFGWAFGGELIYPVQDSFSIRTGLGIVQKKSESDLFNRKAEFVFLEIPVTGMYRISKIFSFFGGLNFDVTLADDGFKSEAFAVNVEPLGARFDFAGVHHAEAFLEFGMTDIADVDLKVGYTLAIRYLYDFNISPK
jgi:hypothetical protein